MSSGQQASEANEIPAKAAGQDQLPPLNENDTFQPTWMANNSPPRYLKGVNGDHPGNVTEQAPLHDSTDPERTAVHTDNSAAGAAASAETTAPKQPSGGPITPSTPHTKRDQTLKLSPAKIHELTSAPDSLCLHAIPSDLDEETANDHLTGEDDAVIESLDGRNGDTFDANENNQHVALIRNGIAIASGGKMDNRDSRRRTLSGSTQLSNLPELNQQKHSSSNRKTGRVGSAPGTSSRRLRSPFDTDRQSAAWTSRSKLDRRAPGRLNLDDTTKPRKASAELPSPVPASVPLPPFSIPTYLQLELSSDRPSPLYIHHSRTNDFPYESSRVKLERLQNFLLLPPYLEQVLLFGSLACVDSWLYYFTILPLRFCKSMFILIQSWVLNLGLEALYIYSFVIQGLGRVWRRRRNPQKRSKYKRNGKKFRQMVEQNSNSSPTEDKPFLENDSKNREEEISRRTYRHRRTHSVPSGLLPNDKADILKGLLMIFTCAILLRLDASRMYHWIRGQAAIKLYVIYNVLEVGDRLLSAIGQDVLECLFSREALERKPDGRSKVLRPFWLFVLALIYTVIHATALFYQVMTLNVAVNSYSNALITLLLSNQFVEIKSTVFKKFEKENLFQLTCADVVERFQLWLMLMIIASRNFVETGASTFGNALAPFAATTPTQSTNSTPLASPTAAASAILPRSFTILPSSVFASLSSVNALLPAMGHVLGPFLVVLGSEMLVDWLKHAYINKFNNMRPSIYGRFLDILTKDYYTNAFGDPNLNRRLGLPIIPLSCLFFRVSIQTYQMFLTAWLPQPPSLSSSNSTSLTSIHNHYSPTTNTTLPTPNSLPTTLNQIGSIIYTVVSHTVPSPTAFVPVFTVILVLLLYVTLLLFKLILGMVLLSYSRARYKRMKMRERELLHQQQKLIVSQEPPAPFPANQSHLPSPPPDSAPPSLPSYGNPESGLMKDTIENSRRVGGWGAVEVGEERRRWIYADDPEGLKRVKDRDERNNSRAAKSGGGLHGIENVRRYEMVAKRIW